jgi:uncharacterized protein involved in exopolysaccharide biosynthesis
MNAFSQEYDAPDDLDLRALFARLFSKWSWIAACVVLSTAAAGVVAFMSAPVYRATTVLVPASAERGADIAGFAAGALGGLGGLASGLGLGPHDADTEEALAVFRSRQFTEDFITGQKLLPKLFANKWDAASGTWKVDDENRPTPAKAYKYFDRKIRSILQDRKTGLITINIDWTDRNDAAAWANELVRELNNEMRARAIAKADASMRFLDAELRSTSTVEARDAISRLMEAQVKQRMLANVTQDYSFRVVDKAIAAEKDDPIRPQKPFLLVAGAIAGLVVGGMLVLLFGPRKADKSRSGQLRHSNP